MAKPTPPAKGLKFYEASHRYKLDGQWVPGVTTILGVLDKPAIPKWAAQQVAEYVAGNPQGVETLRDLGHDPMVQALKAIPWQKRDDAAERGTTLHDYAERILNGEDVELSEDDPLVPVVENAITFMQDWQIEPLLVEVAVGSREHKYAGKLDLIASYVRPDTGHRGVGIFDWKSGKAIYPEYAWQLSAYGYADFYGENGDENGLPECDGAFGVQIRSDGYDVAPLNYGPDVHAEFVLIRKTYDVAKAGRGDWRRPGTGHVGLFIQPAQEAS